MYRFPGGCELFPAKIVRPNGNVVTFTHSLYQATSGQISWRIASIANSYGYSIEFTYQANGTGGASAPPTGWSTRSSATFKKKAAQRKRL